MESPRRDAIHLCQPGPEKSCGACCGLYNWQDHSRAALTRLLRERTRFYHLSPKDGRFLEYREAAASLFPSPKLLETIHNCDFLGFIDSGQRRVGCLLHPSLNDGEEQRWHSVYGAELCAGHYCPSYTYLTPVEKAAVITAVDDWYLYGQVITDIDLVKKFFKEIQARLGDHLRPERLAQPGVTEALLDFFRLKEFWKFASTPNRLGKYFFSYDEYEISRIAYEETWRMKPSRFDRILVSLASEFRTREEIEEAESLIEEKIERFLEAYGDGSPG